MKKVFVVLLALAATCFAANAQKSKAAAKKSAKTAYAFGAGDNVVGASIGFGGLGAPAFGAFYERGLKNDLFDVKGLNLGAGLSGGYYSYETSSNNNGVASEGGTTSISVLLRGALHYQFVHNLDTYVALNMGLGFTESYSSGSSHGVSVGGSSSATGFGYGLVIGGRYYFTKNIAAGAEFGFGSAIGNATITVAFKF